MAGKRTFYIVGLGCPKNRVDSELIWAGLAQAGWRAVNEAEEADLILVNTCAFIQSAVQESVDTILEMANLRADKRARCTKLVVAGCLPARYREKLLEDLPEVDLFVGPAEVGQLPQLIEDKGKRGLVLKAESSFLPHHGLARANSLGVGSAYMKVAEGCSRACTFCIIPKLRGPQHSRSIEDLVAEGQQLMRLGVGEIVMVAQDLAGWGRDLPGKPQLSDLVEALAKVEGLWWLRLMYLFPSEIPERLIQLIDEHETILPYLDLPIQHIDPGVLKGMRRTADPEVYERLIGTLRERLPGVVLRSSLMTGFPGEDEDAFKRLEDFVGEARFERLGVFAFSPEEGTVAAEMPDQVPAELAEERRARIMELQQPIAEAYHQSLVGQSMEVIVDGVQADGSPVGRAWNQAPEVDGVCYLKGHATVGDVVRARVTEADAYDLSVEVIA